MANIETYYLVDFENVNEKGLESSDELGEHDHIYIYKNERKNIHFFNCSETFGNFVIYIDICYEQR